jgi:hypothetical protein
MVQVGLEDFTMKQETHAFALARELNQACALKFLYMVGKRGRRNRLAFKHFAAKDAFARRANLLQDLMTARICQRLRDEPDLALGEARGFGRRILSSERRGHIYVYQLDEIRCQKEPGARRPCDSVMKTNQDDTRPSRLAALQRGC